MSTFATQFALILTVNQHLPLFAIGFSSIRWLSFFLSGGRKIRARAPNSPDLEPTSDLVSSFDGE
jgi:hypothetical protein